MECQEFREEIGEWRRGRLPAEQGQALERHCSTCPECQHWEREESAVRRLLTERLPRHSAPIHLSRQIRTAMAPRPHSWVRATAATALATALAMVLVLLPLLPRTAPPDPLQPVLLAVLSQHTRSILWGEPSPEATSAALPRLMEETGIGLSWVYSGDDEIRFLKAEPVVLQERWGLAFYYTDPEGHMITYVVLPGQGLSLPERDRVAINGFRPVLARIGGFSVFVWKQEGLACFVISDLVSENDLTRFKEYFLRIRSTTAPFPIR